MTEIDEFLTHGLQKDRYLKATQLTSRFETEVETMLTDTGKRMTDTHPELFITPIEGDTSRGRGGSTLAYSRVQYRMNRVQSHENDKHLLLNVHLYWRDPAQCGRRDIDGALRQFGYKIKNLDSETNDRVIDETENLRTVDNPYDSASCFYRHVTSAAELNETADALVDHFERFGTEYGVESSE